MGDSERKEEYSDKGNLLLRPQNHEVPLEVAWFGRFESSPHYFHLMSSDYHLFTFRDGKKIQLLKWCRGKREK